MTLDDVCDAGTPAPAAPDKRGVPQLLLPSASMATISSYQTSSGRRWRVQYRTPDHRNTSKRGFKRKVDAQRFAEEVEVSKRSGDYVQPSRGLITVNDAAVDWLAVKQTKVKPSTWNSLETSWRVHVQPVWGHVRLVDITELGVEKWIAAQADASPTVVLRNHGVLAGVLDNAVRERRLQHNPARKVTNLPRKQRKARTYLTHSQVDQLADAAGPRKPVVLLLAYCGLRWGELVALRGADVDWTRGRIQVRRNVVQVNMRMVEGTPKSGEARQVPVPRFVLDLLPQVADTDLLFPRPDGGYLRRPVSRTGWFEVAVERSGVPRVSVHDLRHTAASLAVSAGANVKVVQRMLGHASAAMTLDTYADLFDDDLDRVAAAMDAARMQSRVSAPGHESAPHLR